ncbi:hypothetical protein CEXT_628731 [Caerostris extrusa]|uniref:Uncharacterized protein n=1 Tax=Caerostris extrusa TaxID=172846 RepID=A0AAV4U6S0_CAEEX|nr:hypothetical protein CEXT_628731 [Caerostris extrusa]
MTTGRYIMKGLDQEVRGMERYECLSLKAVTWRRRRDVFLNGRLLPSRQPAFCNKRHLGEWRSDGTREFLKIKVISSITSSENASQSSRNRQWSPRRHSCESRLIGTRFKALLSFSWKKTGKKKRRREQCRNIGRHVKAVPPTHGWLIARASEETMGDGAPSSCCEDPGGGDKGWVRVIRVETNSVEQALRDPLLTGF